VSKGASTRSAVLGHALALASEVGLEGVTIGTLADRARMSKSGLFAHFDSKEALQIAVLDEAVSRFVETVVAPALRQKRGEPRLKALLENWLRWSNADFMPGGCVFVASIADLDDRPGPVRDRLAASQRDWLDTLATAIRIGDRRGALPRGRRSRPSSRTSFSPWPTAVTSCRGSCAIRSSETRLRKAVERLLASARAPKN
jgi:AcrR family transcriptional regulator